MIIDGNLLQSLFDEQLETLLRQELHLNVDFPIYFNGPVFDEKTFNKNVYLGQSQDALTQLNPMDMISFNWAQGVSYTMEATGYWSDLVTATTPATDAAIVFEKDNGDVGFGLFYWRDIISNSQGILLVRCSATLPTIALATAEL